MWTTTVKPENNKITTIIKCIWCCYKGNGLTRHLLNH